MMPGSGDLAGVKHGVGIGGRAIGSGPPDYIDGLYQPTLRPYHPREQIAGLPALMFLGLPSIAALSR